MVRRGFVAALAAAVSWFVFAQGAFAAEEGAAKPKSGIEEVIVTAERTSESIQDVPIAVTAFTGEMLDAKQIITTSDLQMNTPNTTFTASNFGGTNLTIRGVGSLLIAGGEGGVSIHLDEIPMPTNLLAVEFYDMERVEVLRGPQGTLYGRNATGGVVNMVTAKPNMDAVGGNVTVEYGDYDDQRVKGALNLPVGDTVAIRFAGMQIQRDGYTENTAFGQVGAPGTRGAGTVLRGIDDDVDGRDISTYRITGLWQPMENLTAWVQYNKFHENDDRARITNQVCQRTQIPTYGCDPDGFGFETPHLGTTTGGVVAGQVGAIPYGNAIGTLAFPVQSTGFRKMHTDFEPIYKYDEDTYTMNVSYDFDNFTVSVSGGYQETSTLYNQDYLMDVGPDLAPTTFPTLLGPANPTGYWPTSSPGGEHNAGWVNPQCNFNAGTAGQFGGCLTDADTTRVFAYDQGDGLGEYWTAEAQILTHFDGAWNFLAGVSSLYGEVKGNGYWVLANTLDMYKTIYPSLYTNSSNPHKGSELDGQSIFGEVYWQATDSIKFTVGLRYNDDERKASGSNPFFTSIDACQPIGGSLTFLTDCSTGNGKAWLRTAAAPLLNPLSRGLPSSADATQLAQYYGVYDAYSTTCGTGGPVLGCTSPAAYAAAVQILQQGIPPVPGFNESRILTGSPTSVDFQETTGRAGVDWQLTDNTMVYGFFTRGYKPGGLNPEVAPIFQGSTPFTFDSEQIDAFELGTKNTLFNNSLVLNAAAFYYDYQGLQIGRIVNNTAVNDNIDAKIWGVELETVWRPEFAPNLSIDATYSHLVAEADGATSIDPLDRGAGDPNLFPFKNIDAGAFSGQLFVANKSQITPAHIAQAVALCQAYTNPSPPGCPAVLPGTTYTDANNTPAYFSLQYLSQTNDCDPGVGVAPCNTIGLVQTSTGLEKNIDGNTLPGSPENSFNIGVAYEFHFSFGTLTPRVDYHWQDDMYGREFNSVGDEIPSWDQVNASLDFVTNDGRWIAKIWGRNLEDEDNVTGHYLTSDTSGFFRNYFLTEPLVYGASLRYNFGAMAGQGS